MDLDLRCAAELAADRRLEPVGDGVRLGKRQRAVDLQVERQRQPVGKMLNGDVVHGDALALRDE